MDTIGTAMDAVRRTPRTLENAADRDAKQRMLLQAMIDESYTAQKARETQRQTTDEPCKPSRGPPQGGRGHEIEEIKSPDDLNAPNA
jgi:hypothetical protein